jgi:hypothetical protein
VLAVAPRESLIGLLDRIAGEVVVVKHFHRRLVTACSSFSTGS